ncbi:MAG: UbiD family decarboxylase, partial [Thermofilum sp. ex4484_15]
MRLNLRRYLRERGRDKGYLEVEEELSLKYEVARYLKLYDGGPVLKFTKPKGRDMPIISNIIPDSSDVLRALGAKDLKTAYLSLLKACENPVKLKLKSDAPFQEVKFRDLSELPILTYYEKDGGPYITTGIIIAGDKRTGLFNASIHRMMVLSPTRLTIRVVPRHLYYIMRESWKRGEDLPIAIAIGCHPLIYLASAASPPLGIFELEVANSIAGDGIEGYEFEDGLIVPRETEVVIKGRILREVYEREGPFVDITGTYDRIRMQPVVEVDAIYGKEDALYYALLPAGKEHRTLMSFYREALIWRRVSEIVPGVRAVKLTPGGCKWFHCLISLDKMSEGDPKNAIIAAFAAHPSLKMVIVVDSDINLDDPTEVEWALATRFQPAEDLIVIKSIRGSSLDPSSDQERLLTSKMGIDATIPLGKPREAFEK